MFFDKIGTITRLTVTQANTDKETYQAVSGMESIPINVQPASAETVALSNGVYGKIFDVYTTVSGMIDGDRLTVSGIFIDNKTQNQVLIIQNVRPWYFGPLPHFEITCALLEE